MIDGNCLVFDNLEPENYVNKKRCPRLFLVARIRLFGQ